MQRTAALVLVVFIMETSTEPCVPPGFRFHPTDEELVGYYLKKKVASQKIDLDVIRDIDLYRIEPWDLQDQCRIGYEEQNEWYFFSHKDKKYPTGTRTNRATMAGFWKATGRDKAVYEKTRLVGMRKTLVFYKGRAPNGQKTDWIMHEYRLETDENGLPQEEGWVVCRAFKKRSNSQTKSINELCWESSSSSYFYQDHEPIASGLVSSSSIVDQIDCNFISRRRQPQSNYICKQEIAGTSTSNDHHQAETQSSSLNFFINSSNNHFVQLPQLESPSLPLIKRPSSSISLVSSDNNGGGVGEVHVHQAALAKDKVAVTDWRALDKFVASQLMSQDNNIIGGDDLVSAATFGGAKDDFLHDHSSDLDELLQMHSTAGRSEEAAGNKLMVNGFLGSTGADCDNIGICIFDKLI